MPDSARRLLQHWEQALILGSINLEALNISANAVPCPPALRCLPNLKYLELTLGQSEAWLGYFFVDLSFCASLESFKITQPELGRIKSLKLPEIQLSHLPNLKRVEFTGWFPGSECSLPPDCELCVALMYGKMCAWTEQWEAMQSHLTVLSLGDMSPQQWPEGIEDFPPLQYFRLNCTGFQPGQDLAVLKAIPHVRLYIEDMASLTLTDGAWQNLEVHGGRGLCISFSNADAFVRDTDRFLFVSRGNVELSQPMRASIKAACRRQSKACYECRFKMRYKDPPQVVRLSNCEDAMRLEPSDDGKTVPSGGLHDGYAGTPEDSLLWRRLDSKSIVSSQDMWPVWNPHKWVLGHPD